MALSSSLLQRLVDRHSDVFPSACGLVVPQREYKDKICLQSAVLCRSFLDETNPAIRCERGREIGFSIPHGYSRSPIRSRYDEQSLSVCRSGKSRFPLKTIIHPHQKTGYVVE